jgi:tape measure domain-containing protein
MSSVGNVAAGMFTVGVGAAAAFGAAVVKSGASYNVLYQRSTAAFKTILGSGDAANKMMADLSAFAKTSPFPRQAFIEATQQMLSFGFEAKEVIPTLDAVQNAVAATGGSAKDINEIVNVLAKVRSTGKLSAQTLNELGYRGINAAKMIGDGMGMTADQVREAITSRSLDSQKALKVLTEQMAKTYAGAAEGVKNTWTGATDRIKSAMRDVGSAIVEPFIAKGGGGLALEWANKFADLLRAIEPLVTPIVNALTEKLAPAFQKISGWLDKMIAGVKSFTGGASAVENITGAFTGLAPILAPITGLLLKIGGSQLANFFGPLAPAVQQVTKAFGPWTLGLIAIAATTPEARALLGDLLKVVGELLGPVLKIAKALGQTFTNVLGQLIGALRPVVQIIGQALIQVFRAIAPVIVRVAGALGQALGQAIKAIAPILPELARAFVRIVEALIPMLPSIVELVPPLTDLAVVLLKLALEVIKPLLPLMTKLAEIAAQGLTEAMKDLTPIIKGLVEAFTWLVKELGPLPYAIAAVGFALWALNANPVVFTITAVVLGLGMLYKVLGPIPFAIGLVVAAFWLLYANPVVFVIIKIALVIIGLIAAIVLLVKGIKWLIQNWDEVWNGIKSIFETVVNAIKVGFEWLIVQFETFPEKVEAAFSAVVGFLSGLPEQIGNALASAGEWLLNAGKNMIKGLLDGASWFFSNVFIPWIVLMPLRILVWVATAALWLIGIGVKIIEGLINGIKAAWPTVRDFFLGLPGKIWGFVSGAASWLWDTGWKVLRGMWEGLVNGAQALWSFFRALPGKIWSFVTGAPEWLLNAGKALINGLINGVKNGVPALWEFFKGLPGKILGLVGDAFNWLWDVGRKIIEGMISGIKSMGKKLIDEAGKIVKAPVDKAKEILKIGSPSLVFMEIGEQVGEGLTVGILSAAGEVSAASAALVGAAGVSAPTVSVAPTGAAPVVAAPEGGEAPEAGALAAFAAATEASYQAASTAALEHATALETVRGMQAETLSMMQGATALYAAEQTATWTALSAGIQAITAALAAALVAAFTNLTTMLRALLAAFEAWWRTAWQALALAIQAITASMVAQIIAAFQGWAAQLRAITESLANALRSIWQNMVNAQVFNTNWMREQIVSTFSTMRNQVDQITKDMAGRFSNTMHAMVKAATDGAFNTSFQMQWHLRSAGPPITEIVRNYARSLRDALNPILDGIGKKKIALPFAAGGRVPGTRGGGDSVPAMLTPGEYVIPARAAQRLGPRMLERLQEGWPPVQGFQLGGAVKQAADMLTSRFGLTVTSTYRPGDPGFHGKGQAVDLSGGPFGTDGKMGRASDYIMQSGMFRQLAEGIFNPSLSVKWGKQVGAGFWGASTWAGHANHIHLAITGAKGNFDGGFAVTEAVKMPKVPDVKTGGDWYGKTAEMLMEHVRDVAQKWADTNTFVMDFGGGAGGVAPKGQIMNWINSALEWGKWPKSWGPILYGRAMQESGGNPSVVQKVVDINSRNGDPAIGLFQVIGSTFAENRDPRLPDDRRNPIANTVAAIKYMLKKYGRPMGATGVGYAAGGIIPATLGGRSILAGEGGRDEAVIPLPSGWHQMFSGGSDSLSPAAGQRSGPAVNIEHYEVKENADHRRVFAMAAFEQRAGRI